jgi:hypothetical protein
VEALSRGYRLIGTAAQRRGYISLSYRHKNFQNFAWLALPPHETNYNFTRDLTKQRKEKIGEQKQC